MNDQEYKEFQDKILERDKEIFKALAGIEYEEVPITKEEAIYKDCGTDGTLLFETD